MTREEMFEKAAQNLPSPDTEWKKKKNKATNKNELLGSSY